ncbi:hypothetical protein [Gemella massiliensis]|uniref:hypothetical protein n=1 Tax=Gemella massiliensis TaxID=1909670 RepID=UPI00093199F3|nr:hypothetical protein [Gemella massiliensis]
MVKVKILNNFLNKYTDEEYKAGAIVDFSKDRLEEIEKNLSDHDKKFVQKVRNIDPEEETSEEQLEEAEE